MHTIRIRWNYRALLVDIIIIRSIFPPVYERSMFRISRIHAARSCACSPDNPFSVKACWTLSVHLRFGLPFLLFSVKSCLTLSVHLRFGPLFFIFPGTSITTTLLPPCRPTIFTCTFVISSPIFVVPRIISFRILSSSVTSHIHLNIFISATSKLFPCSFFT